MSGLSLNAVRWLEKSKDQNLMDKYKYLTKKLELNTSECAVIISDMWAEHWCEGATKRVAELAPRMNELIKFLRNKGVKIIYCPSGTENVYKDYAQKKALDAYSSYKSGRFKDILSFNENLIPDITSRIDKDAVQCDCDFDTKCNSDLKPWKNKGQIGTLTIESDDLIGMDDNNVISYLMDKKITHAFVMGVHTNMCVIYRKFGLKALKMAGIVPILVRDMTDSMTPREEMPYQDHFTALDYTVRFVEEYLGLSVLSMQIDPELKVFDFSDDKRICSSKDWGNAKCGEIFDDYELYLNQNLLDPVKLRIWADIDSSNPGINGIEVDYFESDIPSHGSTRGKERVIGIPFGEYVTKMEIRHGIYSNGGTENIIYYIGVYGKNGSKGKIMLGEVIAGNDVQFKEKKTIILEAQEGYRMNCIGGVFSPKPEKLNYLYFRTQAIQYFEIVQNDKTTIVDLVEYSYSDKVWRCFYINGCFRDRSESDIGMVFPMWIHNGADGKLRETYMRNLGIVREKGGTKAIKERKSVEFKDSKGNVAKLFLEYKYQTKIEMEDRS